MGLFMGCSTGILGVGLAVAVAGMVGVMVAVGLAVALAVGVGVKVGDGEAVGVGVVCTDSWATLMVEPQSLYTIIPAKATRLSISVLMVSKMR